MQLIPIGPTLEDNSQFENYPDCMEYLSMSVDFYNRVGYVPPWIGYYVMLDDQFVGSCGFKGKPVNGKVEIAYGTFEHYRNKGIGSRICREMVLLSLKTDPNVKITARTLPDGVASIRVLKNNGFTYSGMVIDDEDGEVCEWEFQQGRE